MTRDEAKKLSVGIYRVFWKNDGGESVAALGKLHDGTPWVAPTNWTSKVESRIIIPGVWRKIERVERLL